MLIPGQNLNDFMTGGGNFDPKTGQMNPNPYGFTAPTGPASQALVPYYNKATGQTWNAPSGGYTPPSADWIQGAPGNSQIIPMPGFAPGMDPVTSYMPQRAPNMIAYEDPEFYKRAAEQVRLDSMPQRAPNMITTEAPPSQQLLNEIRSTSNQQPYMPIMTGTPQQPVPMQQQPTNNLNLGGLAGLFAFPQAPTNPTIKFGGLNALARPQTPTVNQPVVRNQPAPRAGILPSLRIRPNVQRSLPVTFAKPPFRR